MGIYRDLPNEIYNSVRTLRPLFNQKASHIIDDPQWSTASDHRALLSIFNLEK